MSIPVFKKNDGTEITLGHDGYGVWSGNSNPIIKLFPRTKGGIIRPSNTFERNCNINVYMIPPSDDVKRVDIENYMNLLNEHLTDSVGQLTLSGNTYNNCYINSVSYDEYKSKDFLRFNISAIFGVQDENNTKKQLPCPDLYDWSRGRKMYFNTVDKYGVEKSFHFWHNVDNVRNLEVDLNVNYSGPMGDKIVRVGGFERIECDAWVMTFDEGTRQTVEAYMFNMINGPLGMIGTLQIDDPKVPVGWEESRYQNTWNNCFFESIQQDEQLFNGTRYKLTFLTPLQC